MKKRWLACTSLLVAAVMSVALAGCSLFGSTTADGNTPSKVAVSGGAADSREEYLAAQETPSGWRQLYEEAAADGYTGTYIDFLKEIGATSADPSASVNAAVNTVTGIECAFTEYVQTASGRPTSQTQTVYSAGAGVIYSIDKPVGGPYIVTNFHVVYNADSVGNETVSHVSDDIIVYLYGSSESIPATYVGGSINYDIAVLRVEDSKAFKASGASAAKVADSDSISVGESVYAIGNPEGEGISVTSGVVSVDAEYINITAADDSTTLSLLEIRTDAAINHGTSGGGLFNASGELVGIVNARDEGDGVTGFGYAIPSNLATAVARSIIDNANAGSEDKGATRATLGVTVQIESSEGLRDPVTGKTYIEESVIVRSSSGVGAEMGLNVSDTLISAKITNAEGTVIAEKALTRMHMLSTLLFDVRIGDTLTLVVSRNGETVELPPHTFTSESEFTLFAAKPVT